MMKLIYFYTEEYRCLQKQGFTLCADYQVEYQEDSQSGKSNLTVSHRDCLDRMLYGENINVTAIAGDNGAGKSTIMDGIRRFLFDPSEREMLQHTMLLYEYNGELKLLTSIYTKLEIDGEGSEVPWEREYGTPWEFRLFYYSDFLDEKYYQEVMDDQERQIEVRNSEDLPRSGQQLNYSSSHLLQQSKDIMEYFHEDTKRQIQFYRDIRKMEKDGHNRIFLPLPKHLNMSMTMLNPVIIPVIRTKKGYKGEEKKEREGIDKYLSPKCMMTLRDKMRKDYRNRNGEQSRYSLLYMG